MLPLGLLQPPFLGSSKHVRIPESGPFANILRFTRLAYHLTIATPIILLSSLYTVAVHPFFPYFPFLTLAKDKAWKAPWLEVVGVPWSAGFIWAASFGSFESDRLELAARSFIPSLGGTSMPTVQDERGPLVPTTPVLAASSPIPPLVKVPLMGLSKWLLSPAHFQVQSLLIPPSFKDATRFPPSSIFEASSNTFPPRSVPAFWVWDQNHVDYSPTQDGLSTKPSEFPKAKPGEKVLIYFFGGGYVAGHPLLPAFPYSVLRYLTAQPSSPGSLESQPLSSSLADHPTRLLAPLYRLAQPSDPITAFPGCIIDALAAYLYLVDEMGFEEENVCLFGDSAGAGLSWSLVAVLGLIGRRGPGKVAMFSPWIDLSMSHSSIHGNERTDFINASQVARASGVYLQNVLNDHLGGSTVAGTLPDHSSPEYLLSPLSFHELGVRHPLFSPASLWNSDDALSLLTRQIIASNTRFFVHSGDAELFAGEDQYFVKRLRAMGVLVEEINEPGGYHVCGSIFTPAVKWISRRERRALNALRSWYFGGGSIEGGGDGFHFDEQSLPEDK